MTKQRKIIISVLAVAGVSAAIAVPLPLSRGPLFVRAAIDPNIVLTFDDSGSMNEGVTPNEVGNGTYLPNSNAAGNCYWRDFPHIYSAAANGQYYDPDATYTPPSYADGSSYPNAVFTAAYYDGFDAHRTGTENATMPKRNLATNYGVSLYDTDPPRTPTACSPTPIAGRSQDAGFNGNLVTFGTASIATCSTTVNYVRCNNTGASSTFEGGVRQYPFIGDTVYRAFYYRFNNTNPIDVATGLRPKPTIAQLFGTAANNRNSASYGLPIKVTTAEETNFANWFSYYRTRTLTGRTASTRAFAQLPRNVRVAWQGLNANNLANTAPIRRIDNTTQRNNFYSYLNSVSTSGGTPTRAATDRVGRYFSNNNTSGYSESNPYYDANLAALIGANNPATLISCRQNYHLVFTDGGWKDNVGSYNNANTDQTPIAALPNKWQAPPLPIIAGRPYNPTAAASLLYGNGPTQNNIGGYADVSFKYWATDLRTDLVNNVEQFLEDRTTGVTLPAVASLPADPFDNDEVYWNPKNDPATWQHLVQFIVAFGLQSSLDFPGDLNALRGKAPAKLWTDWSGVENGDPAVKVDDTWHAALNSRGELLNASNPTELVNQLNAVFQAISARTSSLTGVSVNSSLLSTDLLSYRTFFKGSSWSGTVQASKFLPNRSTEVVWDAGCLLTGGPCLSVPGVPTYTARAPNSRRIFTSNGSGTGVDFTWANLSLAQRTMLGFNWDTNLADPTAALPPPLNKSMAELRVDFIRGERGQEGSLFRSRESVLGAIVNSSAVIVGAPLDEYWRESDLPVNPAAPKFSIPTSSPETYANFRAHINAIKNRDSMVYAGANDGMLHAFDALTGEERWAFIPNTGFRNLSRLTSRYNLNFQSSVDNTPSFREAYINGGWKTLMVAPMRLGGQGVVALDVTNPSASIPANQRLLWEFNDTNDRDMGYSYGRPFITRLNTGQWVVLLPAGYNSDDNDENRDTLVSSTGNAILFVLNANDGSIIRKFDLGNGTRGLSSVIGGDYVFTAGATAARSYYLNAGVLSGGAYSLDEITDSAFAGDDNGALWRFDFRAASPSSWSVVKFFQAPANQRITVQPRLIPITDPSTRKNNLAVVHFGTGRFVADPDRGDNSQQSMYGIFDPGPQFTGYPLTQSMLQQQIRTKDGDLVITTNNKVQPNQWGWYFNLGNNGERVITTSTFLRANNVIIAQSYIPTRDPALANNPCVNNSASAFYFLDPSNGGPASTALQAGFDVNGNGRIDDGDRRDVSGREVIGIVGIPAVVSPAGGGQLEVLLNPDGGTPSRLVLPDFIWQRQATRDLPSWENN